LKEAGVPKNVFHVAAGGKSVGEILLNLSMDGYFFTGSYKTGNTSMRKLRQRWCRAV